MVTLKDILELINPDSDVVIIYDKTEYIRGTAYNRVSPYLNTPVKEIRESAEDIVIELEPTTTTEGKIDLKKWVEDMKDKAKYDYDCYDCDENAEEECARADAVYGFCCELLKIIKEKE